MLVFAFIFGLLSGWMRVATREGSRAAPPSPLPALTLNQGKSAGLHAGLDLHARSPSAECGCRAGRGHAPPPCSARRLPISIRAMPNGAASPTRFGKRRGAAGRGVSLCTPRLVVRVLGAERPEPVKVLAAAGEVDVSVVEHAARVERDGDPVHLQDLSCSRPHH